jgi:hypothetical protein
MVMCTKDSAKSIGRGMQYPQLDPENKNVNVYVMKG